MVSVGLYLALLAALGLERLFELWLSSRNARAAFASGAVEVGQRHYAVMKALHALFLFSCAAEVLLLERRPVPVLSSFALAFALAAQALRYWAVWSLGARWNTRIIVLPAAAPVTRGPYRFVRHPNYLAVIVEILCVPLVHGAFLTSAVFSLANAALLAVRIRAEEQALGDAWLSQFRSAPRFFPGGPRG